MPGGVLISHAHGCRIMDPAQLHRLAPRAHAPMPMNDPRVREQPNSTHSCQRTTQLISLMPKNNPTQLTRAKEQPNSTKPHLGFNNALRLQPPALEGGGVHAPDHHVGAGRARGMHLRALACPDAGGNLPQGHACMKNGGTRTQQPRQPTNQAQPNPAKPSQTQPTSPNPILAHHRPPHAPRGQRRQPVALP